MVDGSLRPEADPDPNVVVVAGLLLLALIGGLVWLLTRPDDPKPEEEPGLPPAPASLQAVANTSPTEVVLTWEPVADIDGYKITTINPDNGAKAAAVPVDDPDATTAAVTLPASTRMCFQIRSFRGDVESEFSPGGEDEVCDETEAETVPEEDLPPGVPAPEATVEPETEETGGGDPTAGGGGDDGSGDGSGDTGGPPQEFVTVWKVFSADVPEAPSEEQVRLASLGVQVKSLSTADYGLTGPTPSPSAGPSPTLTAAPAEAQIFLYLDGPTAGEAQTACATALSTLTAAGEVPPLDACVVTRRVATRPADEGAPEGSPTL